MQCRCAPADTALGTLTETAAARHSPLCSIDIVSSVGLAAYPPHARAVDRLAVHPQPRPQLRQPLLEDRRDGPVRLRPHLQRSTNHNVTTQRSKSSGLASGFENAAQREKLSGSEQASATHVDEDVAAVGDGAGELVEEGADVEVQRQVVLAREACPPTTRDGSDFRKLVTASDESA